MTSTSHWCRGRVGRERPHGHQAGQVARGLRASLITLSEVLVQRGDPLPGAQLPGPLPLPWLQSLCPLPLGRPGGGYGWGGPGPGWNVWSWWVGEWRQRSPSLPHWGLHEWPHPQKPA